MINEYNIIYPLKEASMLTSNMRHGSYRTRQQYLTVIQRTIKDLYRTQQKINSIKAITQKNIFELVNLWRKNKLQDRTIVNRLTIVKKYIQLTNKNFIFPTYKELNILSTPRNISGDKAVTEDFINQVESTCVKFILSFQIYFGMTKDEVINIAVASLQQNSSFFIIHKSISSNNKDRTILITTKKQTQLITDYCNFLLGSDSLVGKYNKRSINYMYYAELDFGGYKVLAPFRKLYIHKRYQQLDQDNPLKQDQIISQISEEIGIKNTSEIKKWITTNE